MQMLSKIIGNPVNSAHMIVLFNDPMMTMQMVMFMKMIHRRGQQIGCRERVLKFECN
jgi:hypothetical protein